MLVTVTKQPDGTNYLTQDGHGELFSGELKVGDKPVGVGREATVQIVSSSRTFADEGEVVVEFSWVDYLDTANLAEAGAGVRHTAELAVPGQYAAGPYAVVIEDAAPPAAPKGLDGSTKTSE